MNAGLMAAPHPPRREPRRGIVTLIVVESSAIANAMAECFEAVVFGSIPKVVE